MLNRIAVLVAASLLACAPALAQDTRTLPLASPLTGAEKMPAAQGAGCPSKTTPCAAVAVTPALIGTYVAASLERITLQGLTALTGSVGLDLKRTGGTVNATIRSESEISNDYAKLRFSTRGPDGLIERLRIDSGGYVGIGTAAPQAKLDVNGATILRSRVNLAGAPTYASDAAAGTGGLVSGDVYKTSAGALMIKN